MARNTRKNRSKQKGGVWPFTSAPTATQQAAQQIKSAEMKAKINMGRSKSRVSNLLAKPINESNTTAQNRHEFTYTNKDRIKAELQEKIQSIEGKLGVTHEEVMKGIEEGKNTNSNEMVIAVREFIAVLEADLKRVSDTKVGSAVSYGARGSALVLGTLTVFTAQLILKAMRIWLALLVLFLLQLPLSTFGSINLVTGILPNAGFETSQAIFSNLKSKLMPTTVENWPS